MLEHQVVVKSFKQGLTSLLVVGFFVLGANRAVAEVAGQFQFVQGDVSVVGSNGGSQKAVKGLSVNSGDKIVTGKLSTAQLRMQDNSNVAVRQDSELTIADFKYTKNEKTSSVAFKLLRGAFRSVTGWIGIKNPNNYSVITPTATIGVRGTDHEPTYVPPGGWSGAPNLAPGTYDRVYSGETVLTAIDSGAQIKILPGQTGFLPKEGAKPQLVYVVPLYNYSVTAVGNSDKHIDESQAQGDDKDQAVPYVLTQGNSNNQLALVDYQTTRYDPTLSDVNNQASGQKGALVDQAIPFADTQRTGGVITPAIIVPLGYVSQPSMQVAITNGFFGGDYDLWTAIQKPNGNYAIDQSKGPVQRHDPSYTYPITVDVSNLPLHPSESFVGAQPYTGPPYLAPVPIPVDPSSPKYQKLGNILH